MPTKYLYQFEDGMLEQSEKAPDKDDHQSIIDGYLRVLFLQGNKFVEYVISEDTGDTSFIDIPELSSSSSVEEHE